MKAFLLLLLLLVSGSIFAQHTLEAVVLNGMTRQPVANANVYLDGTTIGTSTDIQGKFRLKVNIVINTPLVISHIGHERLIVQDPFRALPKTLYIEENAEIMDEVTVKAKLDKKVRKERLALFKNYFFGYDAYLCRILNENDLILTYDSVSYELVGTARKPLEIINNHLKYYIRFNLIEFRVAFSNFQIEHVNDQAIRNTQIAREQAQMIKNLMTRLNNSSKHASIIGTALFTDIGNDSKSLRKRRIETYNRSFRHFFRLLANNKIKVNEAGDPDMSVVFHIFDYDVPKKLITFTDQESVMVISDLPDFPSVKKIVLTLEMQNNTGKGKSIFVVDNSMMKFYYKSPNEPGKYKNLAYQGMNPGLNFEYADSQITFFTDTFHIDSYGNTDLYDKFFMEGNFGKQRISTLMPLDYSPEQTVSSSIPFTKEQIPESAEERIRYYLEKQQITFPQERLFIHTDKTNYIAGETVWFRAYLTDYSTNTPDAAVSKYVYGELFDPEDSMVMRVKIRRDNNDVFKGYFDLLPDLSEGFYRLRFYTRYMDEVGEEVFFNQNIFIGNAIALLHAHEPLSNLPATQIYPASSVSLASPTLTATFQEDSLIVTVDGTSLDSLRLLGLNRGNICFIEPIIDGGQLSFMQGELPSGILQILLLDSQLKTVSETSVLNRNDKELVRVNISPSKDSYQKREKVELFVELTTCDSIPIQDGFSVSVTAPFSVHEFHEFHEKISTNYADVLKGFIKKPKTFPEIAPEISGQIAAGILRSAKSGQYVKIGATGTENTSLPETTTAVIDKGFDLEYQEYPNGTTYTLQLGPSPSSAEIRLNPTAYPKISIKRPPFNMDQSVAESFRSYIATTIDPYREEWLRLFKDVFSNDKPVKGLSPLSPGRNSDKRFSREELWKNKKTPLRQFLASVEDINIRTDENGKLHLRYRNGTDYFDYVVIVDDRWLNSKANVLYDADFKHSDEYGLEALLSLTAMYFDEIEIIHAPAPPIKLKNFGNLVVNDPALYGFQESLSPIAVISPKQSHDLSHPGYMGVILITTAERNAGISDAKVVSPLGYQMNRDFYSPVYETKEQKEDPKPDLRTTLYWNPNVQTDEAGKAKISFYTPDTPATYTITIKGITKEGLHIHKTEKTMINR